MINGNIRCGVVLISLFLLLASFLPLCPRATSAEGGDRALSSIPDSLTITLDSREKAWLDNHSVVKVGGPRAFPPFHFFDEEGKVKGMAVDYLSFIMRRLGLKIEVQKDLSWTQVLINAKEKNIDVIPCAAQSSDRETYLLFSKPYLSFPLVIISRKDSPFIGGLEDLRGMKVALIRDNSVQEWLERDGIDLAPHFVGSPLEALRAVSVGVADAHIENLAAASYLIEKHGLANLKVAAPTTFQSYSLHFAVRKDWPELVSILDKALMALSPEQHAAIRNHWLSVRYEYGISLADVWKRILMIIVPVSFALVLIFLWNRRLRQEITERKRAEQALRESEEVSRNLFNNTEVAMFRSRLDGSETLNVNEKFLELVGRTREEVIGKPSVVYWVDPRQREEMVRRLKTDGRVVDFDHKMIKKNGEVRDCVTSLNLYPEEGILDGSILDITERKRAEEEGRRLEERLQRAEKMEALGTLAGGVAHDLNNVLGIVVGYSELFLGNIDASGSARSDALQILKAGQRAAAIVQDLLTLARRGVSNRKVLNLNSLISECMKSPEFTKVLSYHPNIEIKTDFEADLLNVSGSSVHLEKSFINLVSNAAEAMPCGGALTVKTANCYLDKPLSGYDEVRQGDYVVLSVSDTGEGIPASDLKRIFEPFYTKKVMGRSGTGLGLAVVWGTLKDHLGYTNVESEEGKGTTFILYFPVVRDEISREQVSISASEYMGNGQQILVVDDVQEQRQLAGAMLKKLNYNVLSVPSGEEAVKYVQDHVVDLMVLDMIMDPGMDGLDTYLKVLEIHPHQKAIIVSGFSETDRVTQAQALGAGAYVKKPYVLEKLGLAVRDELEKTA